MPEPGTAKMNRTQLGAHLREARESLGLQLEDVSKTTRISKNYLIALEQGEFQKLPNAAYVKGFLRLYAGVIGLSGDEVVAMYERADDTATVVVEDDRSQTVKYRAKSSGAGRWLLPLLILAAVLVAALFMQAEDEKKAPAPPPVSKPEVLPVIPPVQPVVSSARLENYTATAAAAPREPMPVVTDSQQRGIFLKLKCIQDSSLNITIDGSLSQHYELKAGDVIEWKAETSFALDIGNAGGVEAEFNGKMLKPFGAAGVSTHVVLKADSHQ